VDRLDTWLNAQRGWRRLAIIGVAWYWPTVCLGFCVSGFCTLAFSSSWPSMPALAIVAIAILAIPASVGVGSIMAVIYSRRARNPKRNKGLPPFLMWRQIAVPLVLLPTIAATTLTADHGPPATGGPRLAGLQMISGIIVIVLAVENYRYGRRFTRSPGAMEPAALADE
jgi:hypothetical protein